MGAGAISLPYFGTPARVHATPAAIAGANAGGRDCGAADDGMAEIGASAHHAAIFSPEA